VHLPIARYLADRFDRAELASEERGFKVAWELSRELPELGADEAYARWASIKFDSGL
jgi:hypothetical protein